MLEAFLTSTRSRQNMKLLSWNPKLEPQKFIYLTKKINRKIIALIWLQFMPVTQLLWTSLQYNIKIETHMWRMNWEENFHPLSEAHGPCGWRAAAAVCWEHRVRNSLKEGSKVSSSNARHSNLYLCKHRWRKALKQLC